MEVGSPAFAAAQPQACAGYNLNSPTIANQTLSQSIASDAIRRAGEFHLIAGNGRLGLINAGQGEIMRVSLMFVAVALAGCAPSTQYIRTDGQYASQQQIESDRAACAAESNDRFCMLERGYFLVSEKEAAAKSAQLSTMAEEERRQAELAAKAEAERQAREKKKRKRHATRQ